MEKELKKITINNNGIDFNFFELELIPSGGKQYQYTNEENKIYFRSLRMGEAKALSKLISSQEDPKISELKLVYQGCISGIQVGDLAEIDFVALMTVINFYTQNNAGWNISPNCPYEDCGKEVSKFVNMFDLDFTEPKYESLPITRTTEEGNVIEFVLPSIDKLEEWGILSENESLDEGILSYAPMIHTFNGIEVNTVEHAYHFLYNLLPSDYEMLEEIDQELLIEMNPIKVTCPHCKKEFDFEFSLKYQKAIPLL